MKWGGGSPFCCAEEVDSCLWYAGSAEWKLRFQHGVELIPADPGEVRLAFDLNPSVDYDRRDDADIELLGHPDGLGIPGDYVALHEDTGSALPDFDHVHRGSAQWAVRGEDLDEVGHRSNKRPGSINLRPGSRTVTSPIVHWSSGVFIAVTRRSHVGLHATTWCDCFRLAKRDQ